MAFKFKDEKGLTLIELLVATALTAIVVIPIGSILRSYLDQTEKTAQRIESLVERALGDTQLFDDLRIAGLSFNFIQIADDEGDDFYTFLPDSTCVPSSAAQGEDCVRTITLDPADATKPTEFVMALGQGGLAPPNPLAPANFYDVTPAADFDVAGVIAFNNNNFMAALKGALGIPANTNIPANLLLRFYSPISRRPAPAMGSPVDFSIPPRFVSLLTMVSANGTPNILRAANFPYLRLGNTGFEQPHPVIPGVDLATGITGFNTPPIDTFWRLLPPVGGTMAFGMVLPLDVVRYTIENGELRRQRYGESGPGTWGPPFVVARDVKRVTFTRDSISMPSILPELEFNRPNS